VQRYGRIDRRVQRTRQLLQDALMALVLEKGYDKITVQSIIMPYPPEQMDEMFRQLATPGVAAVFGKTS